MVEDELADARRFGIPDAEGAALRTLGLVAGGAGGLEALRASVAALELAEGRLEHARSVLELGAALRRAGERAEARDVLREALDATARLGASGLADRAHEELVAAGARPRRDRRLLSGRESLTASEDRVAALAAEGLTNREIAQRQFVTSKPSSGTCATSIASSTSARGGSCRQRSDWGPRTKHWDGSASDTGATAAQDRRHEPPTSTPHKPTADPLRSRRRRCRHAHRTPHTGRWGRGSRGPR